MMMVRLRTQLWSSNTSWSSEHDDADPDDLFHGTIRIMNVKGIKKSFLLVCHVVK